MAFVGSSFERGVVLRDRVLELAEMDVGGAEIRQRVDARRVDGERRLVGVDGADVVAGLLHLQAAEEDPIEIGGCGLSEQRERQDQQEGNAPENGPGPWQLLRQTCGGGA